MAIQETFIDRILQRDNVNAVRRLIIGGLLAAATPFGWPYIAAMSVACITLNAVVMNHEKVIQQKKLLNFYEDEIAALLHKPAHTLTLEDLKLAAAPRSEGGKGIATLKQELDELHTQEKFRIGSSSASSLITTGILVTISLTSTLFLAGGLSTVLGLGLVGFGYTAIAKTVRAMAQTLFGSHETEDMVNQRLMRIAEEIKEKPASAVEVFGLFIDSNPALAMQVKGNFGAEYADLPVIQKKHVVEAYEAQFRVIALTEAMNKGAIPASLVGLIASGDASAELPDYAKYRALFEGAPAKMGEQLFEQAGDVKLSDYRKRIEKEREAAPGSKSLH